MPVLLTTIVVALCVVLLALSAWYAVAQRLYDDWLLVLALALEVALVVAVVLGVSRMGAIAQASERATFVAYLVSLPVIPLFTGFLALKEKSRWAMVAVAIGAFAVAVMMVRVQQIWSLHV